jgi:hypothetical protein
MAARIAVLSISAPEPTRLRRAGLVPNHGVTAIVGELIT